MRFHTQAALCALTLAVTACNTPGEGQARPVEGAGAPGSVDGVVVHTGEGALELVEVQPEGKPRRQATDWANGVGRGDVVLGS